MQAALLANIVFVATWLVSRTAGLPRWTGDGGVEPASTVDVLCVVFEVGIVMGTAATKSLYGIGAHYVRGTSLVQASRFDLMNPNVLLFDGEGPDAKFAGVSYIIAGTTSGFTGDYDPWHAHSSVCLKGGTVVSLSEENSAIWLSETDCTTRGGRILPLARANMLHLWIGPEYMDAPIFAHDHPKLLNGFDPQRDA